MLDPLFRITDIVQAMKIDAFMLRLFQDKEFTDKIIKLNTEKQLYDKGIDSTGKRLSEIGGDYSPITMALAEEKGKPKKSPSDINLNDTDAFYESFRIYLDSNYDLEIRANTIKNNVDLLTEWGEDILGLTEESLSELRDMAMEKVKKLIDERLNIAA